MGIEITNADVIIDEIDARLLRPMTFSVVREFHRHMRLDDSLQIAALTAFDRGDLPVEMEKLQSQLWVRILSLDSADQSGLRLSNCLTRPNEIIDWELGEYLIAWARQQGLTEQQIVAAFHTEDSGANRVSGL